MVLIIFISSLKKIYLFSFQRNSWHTLNLKQNENINLKIQIRKIFVFKIYDSVIYHFSGIIKWYKRNGLKIHDISGLNLL